jgi:[acyl-carrier-protein] S-malonyltransferase
MLAVVAPGQGSQLPGMLTPWLSTDTASGDASRQLLDWFAAVTDLDLVELGTGAPEETIRDTAIAQPLLVATGLLAAAALADTLNDDGSGVDRLPADVLAGHSVGELTAAALSGALSVEAALVLVVRRGRAMAAAAAATTGSMTAVLGGDPADVLAVLARHGLVAANANGGGQVVAAGDPGALAALAADPPARARLRPLTVAGAFHTDHMAPAAESLRRLARGLRPADPVVPVVSNRDGAAVTDGVELLARIVDQVARPVRWDFCQQTFTDLGVTGLLELAPAGTLTGLARRGLPGVETFALRTPADLEGAAAFVRAHRRPGTDAVGTEVASTVLKPGIETIVEQLRGVS